MQEPKYTEIALNAMRRVINQGKHTADMVHRTRGNLANYSLGMFVDLMCVCTDLEVEIDALKDHLSEIEAKIDKLNNALDFLSKD